MRLLVGSVFTSDIRSQQWHSLQLKFLKQTIDEFKHVVFLNGECDKSHYTESEIVGECNVAGIDKNDVGLKQSENHSVGLQCILNYFRHTPADNYLLLDSDCFPILKDWDQVLVRNMDAQHYKPKIAAPIRFENLDTFPHPCAYFIKGEAIHNKWLNVGLGPVTSLIQQSATDTGGNIPLNKCYPLIRSNVYNVHPLFAAVYNHIFYHHSCGSRSLLPRIVQNGYFDHYMKPQDHLRCKEDLFEKLVKSPDSFIDKLTGTTRVML